MRSIVRLLDQSLRKVQGVFEYWDDPDCMFRVSRGRAPHSISLPDSEIPEDAEVLLLHFWNEHMPQIPPEGPTISMAMRAARMLKASFRALAREVQQDPGLADVTAVGGAGVLIYPDAGPGAEGDRWIGVIGPVMGGCVVFDHLVGIGEFALGVVEKIVADRTVVTKAVVARLIAEILDFLA